MMEKFSSLVTAAVTVVMAIATVLLGLTVPMIWTMSGDMGGLKVRAEEIVRRLDGIEPKIDAVVKQVDSIDFRLSERDSDPSTLIARAGLRPESEFAGVRVGQKLFALPKTDKANHDLTASGLTREPITPSAFGYVIGTYDHTGRLNLVQPSTTGATETAPSTGVDAQSR